MLAVLFAVSEPSHVPFYIAGGVFALWAVVLSWVGLTRAAFPFGEAGERAVIGVSLTLAVVVVAMAIVTSK